MRLRAILPLSGILLAGLVGIAAAQPVLSLPIACEVGRNCFVQNYVDVDPSQEAQDYRCGALTYNGHNGTDFRIPTVAAQRNGVEILTAAPGRVSRVRDGVEDVSARTKDPAAISGKECGNGLVI